MSIIHRRVFFCRIGTADQLVQHFQEAETVMQRLGTEFKTRFLSDYLRGRSDRVVMEWEVNSLSDIDAAMETVMTDPEAQAFFGPWMTKLNELVEYSEAENWTVR